MKYNLYWYDIFLSVWDVWLICESEYSVLKREVVFFSVFVFSDILKFVFKQSVTRTGGVA